MKILRTSALTFLSLGIISIIGLLLSSHYSINNCTSDYCGMSGVIEVLIIFLAFPLILLGLILYTIYYFFNRKNVVVIADNKKINIGKIILSVTIGMLIVLAFAMPGLYVGLYNYRKYFIEVIFGF